MPDSMVNAWSILDHETTPRQRTLLDEIYHRNMTYGREILNLYVFTLKARGVLKSSLWCRTYSGPFKVSS
jgi:hypothetical protein